MKLVLRWSGAEEVTVKMEGRVALQEHGAEVGILS